MEITVLKMRLPVISYSWKCMGESFFSHPAGEPLNVTAWKWYTDKVGQGRCHVVDAWWQTGEYTTKFACFLQSNSN